MNWSELVDQSIRSVGGYWPPLAGMARLTEEIGELAVEFRRQPLSMTNLAEELADVFFISTCIANQYLADLGAAYANAGIDETLILKSGAEPMPAAFFDLVVTAGSLARTVNLYEGSKPLKPAERITRIGETTAQLHRALCRLAAATNVRLADEVRASCERKSKRDGSRFKTSCDASLCPARDAFRAIQSSLLSSIGRWTRVWGASPWVESDRWRSLDRISQELARFARVAPHESLDGFVVELPGQPFGLSVAHAAAALKYLLSELGRRDASVKQSAADGFEIAGQRLLIEAFGSCFGQQSPRSAFGNTDLFLVFYRGGALKDFGERLRWWEADAAIIGG